MGVISGEQRVLEAVRNNAAWCDTLCQSYGAKTEFHEAYWINRGVAPPYTSRLITLAGSAASDLQVAEIRGSMAREGEAGWGVKDAFACLDLAPLGFRVLFEATWTWCDPGHGPIADADERLNWSVVESADELGEWERAWRGSNANRAVKNQARVFSPALLAQPGIHFLLGRREGLGVASAVLNRTGSVAGLSNVFTADAGAGLLFSGLIRAAGQLYPGVPIVGYERGDDLLHAERAGFSRIAPLRVWDHP
jgi:hypothetical protein